MFAPAEAWFKAVNDGDINTVTYMMQRHAKTLNEYGETALMCAVKLGDLGLVGTLAPHEAGCFHGKNGSTALMQAAARNMADVSALLAPFEAKLLARKQVSAAMIAAENNAAAALCSILPYYQNSRDESGMSALDYAAKTNSYESAILLAGSGKHTPEEIKAASSRASGKTENILLLLAKSMSNEAIELVDISRKYDALLTQCERMSKALTLVLGADYAEASDLLSIANAKRREAKELQIALLDREAEVTTLQKHYIRQLEQHEQNMEHAVLTRTNVSTLASELQFYKNRYMEIKESALFKITYPNEEVTGAVCETINADIMYKHKRLESLVSEVRRLKEAQKSAIAMSSPAVSPITHTSPLFADFNRTSISTRISPKVRDDQTYFDKPVGNRPISPISVISSSPKVGMSYSTKFY